MSDRSSRHNVLAARELRGRETRAEDRLWVALRGRRLDGLKFRRQHPVGPFVLDSCCVEHRLAIEVDGEIHATQRERDAAREALIAATGLRVLRFTNDAIEHDLGGVLAAIRAAAQEDPPARAAGPGRTPGW